MRQYRAGLVEGLLLTLPEDPAARRKFESVLLAIFEDCRAGVDGAAHRPFAAYARLNLLLGIARELADRTGDFTLTDRMEAALEPLFGTDTAYTRERDLFHDTVGVAAAAGNFDAAGWVERGQLRQARDEGNFDLSTLLVFSRRDRAAIDAWVTSTIAADAASRAGGGRPGTAATLHALLLQGLDLLDPQMLREAVLDPILATPYGQSVLFDIYRAAPALCARLRDVAGHDLIARPALIDIIVLHGNDPMPSLRIDMHARAMAADAMVAGFTADEELALYSRFLDQTAQAAARTVTEDGVIAWLLRGPLTKGQQSALRDGLRRDIASYRPDESGGAAALARKLLVLDALPDNRGFLLEAAGDAARRFPQLDALGRFLDAWYAYGLGLAIVKVIAELHGGWVTAANMPDGGALFAIAFDRQAPCPVVGHEGDRPFVSMPTHRPSQ